MNEYATNAKSWIEREEWIQQFGNTRTELESWKTPEEYRIFLFGEVLKYMGSIDGDLLENHRKAARYLQKLIDVESK